MTREEQFARAKAIAVLECMAIDLTGALASTAKTNPMADVLEQRLEAIDTAQAALRGQESNASNALGGWISVEERLPEVCVSVLTIDKYGHIHDRYMYKHKDGTALFTAEYLVSSKDVTHWMPLPEPPEVAT